MGGNDLQIGMKLVDFHIESILEGSQLGYMSNQAMKPSTDSETNWMTLHKDLPEQELAVSTKQPEAAN